MPRYPRYVALIAMSIPLTNTWASFFLSNLQVNVQYDESPGLFARGVARCPQLIPFPSLSRVEVAFSGTQCTPLGLERDSLHAAVDKPVPQVVEARKRVSAAGNVRPCGVSCQGKWQQYKLTDTTNSHPSERYRQAGSRLSKTPPRRLRGAARRSSLGSPAKIVRSRWAFGLYMRVVNSYLAENQAAVNEPKYGPPRTR